MDPSNIILALDAMSGDHGHPVVVSAALRALKEHPQLHLILVGDEPTLRTDLKKLKASAEPRIHIHHATEVVAMDELPSKALRGKKDSSMRVAINLVKDGNAHACVSAGNTGALMATARFVLKTLPGIDRPAIISAVPSLNGHTYMLDLGANADCPPEQLFQFAVMGSVVESALHGEDRPRIGLLNIGTEEIKGNENVQKAHQLLSNSTLNYIGFVEGNDIYLSDKVDVVVCDGFVGNVALKTSEGVAKLIAQFMREEFQRNPLSKLAALTAMPVLNGLKRRMDPRNYNGASFIGLNGIVIKSHGSADALAFATAITVAVKEVEKKVVQTISERLAEVLAQAPPTPAAAVAT